jgi:hypothetical protein
MSKESTLIIINRKTGAIQVSGESPCDFCKEKDKCDKKGLKPCWIPCG